jgi:hypothetical protein
MKVKRENIAVKAKLSEMETDTRKFKNEREKMKESLLDLKCRSMKYNLVFTGLKETPYENTEEMQRGFLGQELVIISVSFSSHAYFVSSNKLLIP